MCNTCLLWVCTMPNACGMTKLPSLMCLRVHRKLWSQSYSYFIINYFPQSLSKYKNTVELIPVVDILCWKGNFKYILLSCCNTHLCNKDFWVWLLSVLCAMLSDFHDSIQFFFIQEETEDQFNKRIQSIMTTERHSLKWDFQSSCF